MKTILNNEIERDAPLTLSERIASGLIILWLMSVCFILSAFTSGCATKTRNVEVDGLFINESGTLAIGSVDVMAAPIGEESAIIKYGEDTAWLSPSTKTHAIRIQLTGTNCTEKATGMVESICRAFVPAAAIVNGVSLTTNAPSRAASIIKAATTASSAPVSSSATSTNDVTQASSVVSPQGETTTSTNETTQSGSVVSTQVETSVTTNAFEAAATVSDAAQ